MEHTTLAFLFVVLSIPVYLGLNKGLTWWFNAKLFSRTQELTFIVLVLGACVADVILGRLFG